MLSTDHDFTVFLASRDVRRVSLERPVPDFRTIRTREYDAATVRCLGVLHAPPVHDVHDVPDVLTPTVANFATTRPKFTFTDAHPVAPCNWLAKGTSRAAMPLAV